jgi:HTH-type transcriptional regulator/antitoxin HipB
MKLAITSSAQLSTHFKSLRKAKGWSQADLGRKLGVGQARVAQIESDPGSISVDKLLQILNSLDAKLVVDAQVEPKPLQHVAGEPVESWSPDRRTSAQPQSRSGMLLPQKSANNPSRISNPKKKW